MFSNLSKTIMVISATFVLSSANASNLDHDEILLFAKGLKHIISPFPVS